MLHITFQGIYIFLLNILYRTSNIQNQQWVNTTTTNQPITTNYTTSNIVSGRPVQFNTAQFNNAQQG